MSENSTPPRSPRALRPILRTAARLLTFRLTGEEFAQFDQRHLLFGLLCTWLVGVGRWWDDPGAGWLQHAGAGSVVYIFILALLLWLVVLPLKPNGWTYRHVLTFVALTAPPALLYAIPVEKFVSLATARSLNVWFLATVALWRVALLFNYLKRHARLRPFAIFTASLLPVTAIIVALTMLNLERAVFDVMGGLREQGQGAANDNAYAVLILLSLLSMLLFLPLLACYVVLIVVARSKGDEYRVASGG
ncbi:MAG TPA: hypothetical protein VEY11_17945 [Pyrinomonadaceae bacterium]|nr:hypothetical protein [Pyrinomonadaceae bacterium]